jgi:hypothetical protein
MAFRNFRATSLSIGREIHLGRIFFTDFNKLNGVQQKRDAAFPVIGDTIAIVLVATPRVSGLSRSDFVLLARPGKGRGRRQSPLIGVERKTYARSEVYRS